jgi:hypothetical protein
MEISLTDEQVECLVKILSNVKNTLDSCERQLNNTADVLEAFGVDPSVFLPGIGSINDQSDHISNILFKIQKNGEDVSSLASL